MTGALATDLHGRLHGFIFRDRHRQHDVRPHNGSALVDGIDPDPHRIRLTASTTDRTPLPREDWPDLLNLLVIAENTSPMPWAIDTSATPSNVGWGDGYDTLHPIGNLSDSIETMIEETVGIVQNDQFRA